VSGTGIQVVNNATVNNEAGANDRRMTGYGSHFL
jgi:hypothetical protein